MIKQIQLRGISRTPSDRLSEDGGLSESLNMYMDTAENAPAIVPTDVTADLGLPEGLSAERIFIHKTANYENYIVVQRDKVVAYTPDIKDDIEPITILDIVDGEELSDITSIGNTLILTGTKNMYYVLYRDRKYVFLGNKVPYPFVSFVPKYENTASVNVSFDPGFGEVYPNISAESLEEEWNRKNSAGEHTSERVLEKVAQYWEQFDKVTEKKEDSEELFCSPVFVRYAVEMYDDSVLISSMPILMSPWQSDIVADAFYLEGARQGQEGEFPHYVSSLIWTQISFYKIACQIINSEEIDNWRDLYKSINIYITRPFKDFINRKATTIYDISTNGSGDPNGEYEYRLDAKIRMTPLAEEALLVGSKDAFEVKKIEIFDEKGNLTPDYEELRKGFEILPSIVAEGKYEDLEILGNDDMKHYLQTSPKLSNFNNRLILVQPSQLIDYDYARLNSYDVTEHVHTSEAPVIFTYDVTYLLRSNTEDKVVKKQFIYTHSTEKTEDIYAFQIFPDSRAYKMIVKVTYGEETDPMPAVKYGEFDMYPHPYLDCAYYCNNEGVGNKLWNLCSLDTAKEYSVNATDDLENKLIISEMNDPFVFPLNSRYAFQSKVIGVAVANTALSQGQFGQFPLYVFTEDGIWAMETASDGSFVSQKPLSREVCINPDSITSIDNAVVFVTSKGVMMIQGSVVTNISAYMNGKHYIPNESAKDLVARQEGFSEYEAAISDETPFTTFMKDAKVAYDYNGQRLIFISPDNKGFQYIYKIDTQTWHKVAFEGFDLVQPLNSFPDCLIQGKETELHTYLVCLDNNSVLSIEQLHEMVADFFPYDIAIDTFENFLTGNINLPLDGMYGSSIEEIVSVLEAESVNTSVNEITEDKTCVYDFSTILDPVTAQPTAKGILITRPFDLGMPDVFKSITNIKVRGYYDREKVKFILQGSNNGKDFYTMNSFRGKSWKMFRLFILADLGPTERISWIDIEFEPRYNNKLR